MKIHCVYQLIPHEQLKKIMQMEFLLNTTSVEIAIVTELTLNFTVTWKAAILGATVGSNVSSDHNL